VTVEYSDVIVEYSDVTVVLVNREQEDYVSLSFRTISAVGFNAAVIHYRFEVDILLSECYILCCFEGVIDII